MASHNNIRNIWFVGLRLKLFLISMYMKILCHSNVSLDKFNCKAKRKGKKKRIRFENTPLRIPTSHMPEFLLWQVEFIFRTKSVEQVCMSVRSPRRVRRTHTHTDDVKTITPITSETWGVITSSSEMKPTDRMGHFQRVILDFIGNKPICHGVALTLPEHQKAPTPLKT